MRDSINPADFQTFTRPQAIANLKVLDEDGADYGVEPTEYASMSNDELEAEICMAGIVHDADMKGVFDTEREALAALMQARAEY